MSQIVRCLMLGTFLLVCGAVNAQSISANGTRSLDGQVQEIKSDVLDIAAELGNLEERLLYPSNTQLAVFVALAEGEDFRLDAVRLTVNGELAMHHIYSFKELDALKQGGVQRLFTGNVPTGQHEIGVEVIGKLKSGKDFSTSDTFTIAKEVAPKTVGITLAGPGLGSTPVSIGDW